MSIISTRMLYEPLRGTDFSDITGAYTGIGAPFANPILWFHIINNTNEDVVISLNGIDNHLYLPSGAFIVHDIGSNKGLGGGLYIAQVTRFYVAAYATLPVSGIVSLAVAYGVNVNT